MVSFLQCKSSIKDVFTCFSILVYKLYEIKNISWTMVCSTPMSHEIWFILHEEKRGINFLWSDKSGNIPHPLKFYNLGKYIKGYEKTCSKQTQLIRTPQIIRLWIILPFLFTHSITIKDYQLLGTYYMSQFYELLSMKDSLNPHKNLMRNILSSSSSFYKWRNWRLRKVK